MSRLLSRNRNSKALLMAAARTEVPIGNFSGYNNDQWTTTQTTTGKQLGFTTISTGYSLTDGICRFNVSGSTKVPMVSLYSGGSTGSPLLPPTTVARQHGATTSRSFDSDSIGLRR